MPPVVPIPEPTIPIHTGGPPYPQYPSDATKHGLSIVDWFAGHALAGLMANANIVNLAYIEGIPDIVPAPQGKDSVQPLQIDSSNLNVLGTYVYDYNDPVEPPPLSGRFRLNSAYALASLFWPHNVTKGGTDIGPFLLSLKIHDQILIQIRDDPNIYRRYEIVTAPKNMTDYAEIEIRHMEGSGTIPKLTECTITFFALAAGAPPITSENLARTAYYAAAWMVQLRSQVPIEPTPVPPPIEGVDAPSVVRMMDRSLQPRRVASQKEIDQRLNPLTNEVPPAE